MSKQALKVKINELADNKVVVDIEVPADRCKSSYEAAIARMGSSIRLPGFRPGKVPKPVIIQQIGITRIKASALEKLIDQVWKEAIAQESIEPVSEAQLKEELQSLVDRFNPNENVSFTLETEVSPAKKKG
ncbi:trigger factor family protein [Prochlorococcus sp. MIT 1307]|uniref:trigger factor family protein n=1 Tax=Prochlorococcus sp. MIT 1307 TaxID=3096219 RepID=UPI002A75558F|nr:trigger factor family protein [Prochlorococcus sp. MIT 1307]